MNGKKGTKQGRRERTLNWPSFPSQSWAGAEARRRAVTLEHAAVPKT